MDQTVKDLIGRFNFKPLPAEGTFFASTWRSNQEFSNGKPFGTAMIGMYCNEPLSQSLFHRLPVDEIWHFYGGDPFRLVLLYPDGSSNEVVMGNDPLHGQHIQYVVQAGRGRLHISSMAASTPCLDAPWLPVLPDACMKEPNDPTC
mgnify:FL=1